METVQKQRDKYSHSLFEITQVYMNDELMRVSSAPSSILPTDPLSPRCSGTPSPHNWTPEAWARLSPNPLAPQGQFLTSAYHRVTEQLWWEGTSRDPLIQPPAQARSAGAGCSGPCWHPCSSHQHKMSTFGDGITPLLSAGSSSPSGKLLVQGLICSPTRSGPTVPGTHAERQNITPVKIHVFTAVFTLFP